MRLVTTFAALTMTAAVISGCNQQNPTTNATINQSSLCEASSWQYDAVASVCKPGQKVVFLPQSWGNEQLPVIFAAVNCDLRYSVAMTKGAVTCIYGPITPTPTKNPESPQPAK